MPQGRPQETVNKEALNALVDLYYLYSDIATHIRESSESPQELDLFFNRPGGLKELLEKYYTLASINQEEAGSHVGPLTLDLMLPRDNSVSFYRAHDELWQQIVDVTGDLKGYNRDQGAVGTQVPQEVTEVVNEGRHIIARRTQRSRSGADAATVDLASAVIAYQDGNLLVDTIPVPLEQGSLMDLVTKYMVTQKRKGEQADVAVISTWIDSESIGLREPSGRAIKDACRAVNERVHERLVTAEDFFNTSTQHRVIRRY